MDRRRAGKTFPRDLRYGSALNQHLSPLIELQKLDLRIMEITDQRRKIPERLHAVEAPLREAKQSLHEMSAAVEASVKERRAHERDVEAQDAHTDKMRARLSELKTNKEYQAHLFELQMANKKKSEIEDKVLAKRAVEKRFTVQELLLFSSVSGTGLDVVPIPGNTTMQTIANILTDVASLSLKYTSKALSVRLFLIPGKEAGDIVKFENPNLTSSVVMNAY